MRQVVAFKRVLVHMATSSHPLPPPGPVGALSLYRTSDPDDALINSLLPPNRLPHARRCLARGDVAHLAFNGDDLAGWVWTTEVAHRDRLSGVIIQLDEGECYWYDMWVHADQRRSGAGRFMLDTVSAWIREQGIGRSYAYTFPETPAIHHMIKPYGFHQVHQFWVVQALDRVGWQIPRSDRPRGGPCTKRRPARPGDHDTSSGSESSSLS